MQAKPLLRRHLGRSVKSVAFLALTIAMALISALLIVQNLTQASEPDPLLSVFLLAHEGGPIDHSPPANPDAVKEHAPMD